MRALLPVLCFLPYGCDPVRNIGPGPTEEVVDRSRRNKLTMHWVYDGPVPGGGVAHDFHSLAWRTKEGDEWKDRVVISRDAFQAGSPRRRWVSQIHSLDATKGTAIIKVAEGNVPKGSQSTHFVYSWREWGLVTNGEVRLIRICTDPFEKY